MGEQQEIPCKKKERARNRAALVLDVAEGGRAVGPPQQRARRRERRKEVLEEDAKSHELLRIDMDWGIDKVRPEAAMEMALEENPPAQIRRIRLHHQMAILYLERPEGSLTLGRPQRGNPRQIPQRLRRKSHDAARIRLALVDRVEVPLKKPGMKTHKRNSGNYRRQMAEKDLETMTRHGNRRRRRRHPRHNGTPPLLVDVPLPQDGVPHETEEAEVLRRNQRRLGEVYQEADAVKERESRLDVGRTLLSRPTDDEDIVEVPNRTNPPSMKELLEMLGHESEEEGGGAEAEGKDFELEELPLPAKAEITTPLPVDGNVKVGVFQVDGRRPIPWAKKKGHVLHRVHAEVWAIDEKLVEAFQIDDGSPAHRLRNEEYFREEARLR